MPDNAALNNSLQTMQEEMRDIRSMMGKMAEALTKLSVLEERNLIANETIKRVVERQEKTDERVNGVVLQQVKFQANIDGVSVAMKWMWAAFGSGIVYIGGQAIKHLAN